MHFKIHGAGFEGFLAAGHGIAGKGIFVWHIDAIRAVERAAHGEDVIAAGGCFLLFCGQFFSGWHDQQAAHFFEGHGAEHRGVDFLFFGHAQAVRDLVFRACKVILGQVVDFQIDKGRAARVVRAQWIGGNPQVRAFFGKGIDQFDLLGEQEVAHVQAGFGHGQQAFCAERADRPADPVADFDHHIVRALGQGHRTLAEQVLRAAARCRLLLPQGAHVAINVAPQIIEQKQAVIHDQGLLVARFEFVQGNGIRDFQAHLLARSESGNLMRQGVFAALERIDKPRFFLFERGAILNFVILLAHLVARPSRVGGFFEERCGHLRGIDIARALCIGVPADEIHCGARPHFASKSPTIHAVHALEREPVPAVVPGFLEQGKYAGRAPLVLAVFDVRLPANGLPAFDIARGHAKAQI